jgi:MFS family permease
MNKKLFWLYLLSIMVYACQGIEGIPGMALFFYLKEHLHFSPEKIMYIGSIVTIPWLIKPIFGFFIDNFMTQKKWIIASLIGSIIISFWFGLSPILTIPLIIGISILGNLNTAIRDIANDGLACVEGKANDACATFQNVQWLAITVAGIFAGLAGGYIADHYNYRIGYLCLLPFYLIILGVISKYKVEKPSQTKKKPSLLSTLLSYKELFLNKKFMLGCLFILLYNFNPSFGTPLAYVERDTFHWSGTFMGGLGAITSAISIIGSILYYKYGKRIDMKKCLFWSVFIGAGTTLSYLYFTPVSAVVYGIIYSVIGMFIFLTVMTFMAQSTIAGKEATSFALLCSVNNLAGTLSGLVGAMLFPILGLKLLIILASVTSFLALPLIKKLEIK